MNALDPRVLGWHEFWARIALAGLVLLALLTVVLFVGRIVLSVYDLAMWVRRKIIGEEEEMSPATLHRALLKLVPTSQRAAAEKLLRRLLALRAGGCEVFVAEYDGQPATVHTAARTAQQACARFLNSEPGPDIPWDWFEDEFGWVQRRVDLDTGKPESLLGGKVTRAEVSA